MPNRPYTEIRSTSRKDFLATPTVSGTRDPLFESDSSRRVHSLHSDLAALSRNTTLHLQETNLTYLHIELTVSPATWQPQLTATPEMVLGVTVSAEP